MYLQIGQLLVLPNGPFDARRSLGNLMLIEELPPTHCFVVAAVTHPPVLDWATTGLTHYPLQECSSLRIQWVSNPLTNLEQIRIPRVP